MRWDMGFITDKDTYVEQRQQLQKEVEALTPIPDDDLAQAAEILRGEWTTEKVRLMLNKVYVEGNEVVAIELKPNYHIIINQQIIQMSGRRDSNS